MDKNKKFDKFYESIKDMPDDSLGVSLLNKFKLSDDRTKQIEKLIEIMKSNDNSTCTRFTAAFKLYEIMDNFKKENPDNGKKAKEDLMKIMPDKNETHNIVKLVIRIYHFFNSGLLRNKGTALLQCNISYREFRTLKEIQWEKIASKFEINEMYKSDDNYWRIRKISKEKPNDSESDETIV